VRLSRWIAAAALGCLALAAAYLPPEPGVEWTPVTAPSGEEARLQRVTRALARVHDQLSQLRFRDSLRSAVSAAGSRGADVEVVIRGPLPEASRRTFRTAVERVWRRAAPASGARLLVLLDPVKRASAPLYVLPGALDGRTCAASLTLDYHVGWLRREAATAAGTNLEAWLVEEIGLCLFYGAFGRPGPSIEAWLVERSFTVAATADWDAAPRSVSARESPQMPYILFSNMSFDALACIDGQLPRCRSAVAYGESEGVLSHPRVPRVTGVARRTFWPRSFALDEHYLAALVRDMGRERFAAFWRSPGPIDSAFQSAFGQSVESWTAGWARAFVPDLPPLSPAPRPIAVVLALALGAIAVAASAAVVMRRQVN
jgi:hypothetical protein